MKKFVCIVCGYIYEGETTPAECSQCHAGADKFKEMTGGIDASVIDKVINQVEETRDVDTFNKRVCADIISILEELKQYAVSVSEEEIKNIMIPENRIHNKDYYNYESQVEEYKGGVFDEEDLQYLKDIDKWELSFSSNDLYAFRCYGDCEDIYVFSVELDNGEYSDLFAVKLSYEDWTYAGKQNMSIENESNETLFNVSFDCFHWDEKGYSVFSNSNGEELEDYLYFPTIDRLLEYAKEEGWI